jgi:hypothetical protein
MENVVFVINSYGVNEIIENTITVEGIEENEWEEFEVESNIVSKYELYDSIARISYDDEFSIQDVLDEVDRLDEILWG